MSPGLRRIEDEAFREAVRGPGTVEVVSGRLRVRRSTGASGTTCTLPSPRPNCSTTSRFTQLDVTATSWPDPQSPVHDVPIEPLAAAEVLREAGEAADREGGRCWGCSREEPEWHQIGARALIVPFRSANAVDVSRDVPHQRIPDRLRDADVVAQPCLQRRSWAATAREEQSTWPRDVRLDPVVLSGQARRRNSSSLSTFESACAIPMTTDSTPPARHRPGRASMQTLSGLARCVASARRGVSRASQHFEIGCGQRPSTDFSEAESGDERRFNRAESGLPGRSARARIRSKSSGASASGSIAITFDAARSC